MARTWFITGTSSGFGRLMTEMLLARGDRVAATLRRPGALDDLQAQAGDRLRVYTLDLTDRDSVYRAVGDAFADLGTIDVVVNNAGFGLFGSVEEVSDAQIERLLDTNLLGSIHVIRAVLPHLREQGHGHILQVSSAGGQTTYPGFGYYHAAKWGIEGLAETVKAEIAPLGIDMTIVEPGATPTGFSDNLAQAPEMEAYVETPVGESRRGEFPIPNDADKVADAVIDLVDRGETPLRLPLGLDTYHDVRGSYVKRLDELDAHREVAESVAADGA